MSNVKSQIIIGRNPVIDAIKSGIQIEKLYLAEGITGSFEQEIRALRKQNHFPVQFLPLKKLNEKARGNHQGAVLVTSLIEYQKIENIIPFLFEQGITPTVLLLDGVTDVRNFGAIARTAEVFGVNAIVVPSKGSALINEFAIKASAGALVNIPVCREKSLTGAIKVLKSSGISIFASDLKADKKIDAIDFNGPCAILIGSEEMGVNKAYIREADDSFIIPQEGITDSLNVSVATGVILYELNRQRNNNK